jgi:hypothetical protein
MNYPYDARALSVVLIAPRDYLHRTPARRRADVSNHAHTTAGPLAPEVYVPAIS